MKRGRPPKNMSERDYIFKAAKELGLLEKTNQPEADPETIRKDIRRRLHGIVNGNDDKASIAAARELMDRLDGKPAQSMNLAVTEKKAKSWHELDDNEKLAIARTIAFQLAEAKKIAEQRREDQRLLVEHQPK